MSQNMEAKQKPIKVGTEQLKVTQLPPENEVCETELGLDVVNSSYMSSVTDVGREPTHFRSCDQKSEEQSTSDHENRIYTKKEWDDMMNEMNALRKTITSLSNNDELTATPKRKHTNLFDDDAEMTSQIETLKEKIEDVEKSYSKATRQIEILEEGIVHSSEDARSQLHKLEHKWIDFEKLLACLKEEQELARSMDINKLLQLKKQNEKYREELNSVKKERERLLEIQERHYQMLLQESVPKSAEALQSLLVSYRKSLASTRADKDAISLKFQRKTQFMEEKLKSEQISRSQMESSLASELHDARGEILSLKSINSELDKTVLKHSELLKELEKSNSSLQISKTKSDETIQALKERTAAEIKTRENVEKDLAEARHKLKSLHKALETSEQVQRDFVRLSQSLQVELEQVKTERNDAETKRASEQDSEAKSTSSGDSSSGKKRNTSDFKDNSASSSRDFVD